MEKIAVRVGYTFNVFLKKDVAHINLKPEQQIVEVEGVQYTLHSATTFEQSEKIDALLDKIGELRIKDYVI